MIDPNKPVKMTVTAWGVDLETACRHLEVMMDSEDFEQLHDTIRSHDDGGAAIQFKNKPLAVKPKFSADPTKVTLGTRCCCGAKAAGRLSDGEPRCCATCAFHPAGCRCFWGDPPDTINTEGRPA